MKHVTSSLYANTYTLVTKQSNETIFYKNIGEKLHFLVQRGGFSSTQGAGLVSRRLEQLEEEESSPCVALRQKELGFQPLNPSRSR